MDENSSDSICSDDTEYLLGQNVSIREIDDYEEKPLRSLKQKGSKYTTTLTSQQNNTSKGTRKSLKKQDVILLQDSNKYQQLHQTREQTKHVDSHQQRSKTTDLELTPHEPRTLKKPAKENIRQSLQVDGRSHTSHQNHESTSKSPTQSKTSEKRKTNVKSSIEERCISEESVHKQSEKKEMRNGNRRRWQEKVSPLHQEQSWDWKQSSERQVYLSPEQADVLSVTSEAATEELLKDDELDGSIIQKLKELNLAVNYDPDTQELFDDKVREGAHLLSKLFGGSVDNYYSSPSAHSGSASGQEISRGESDVEEKRNISNTSSRGSMTSFTSITHQSRAQEDLKKTLERKPKAVSFATDDSISFETSPSSNRSKSEHFVRSPMQSHKINKYGRFVKETTALRAAMDYGNDDDDDDDDGDDEQSPDKPSSPGKSRKILSQVYHQKNSHDFEDYLPMKNTTRFSVEKYSDTSQGKAKGFDEPLWDSFLTSTPHKNKAISPSSQIETKDIKKKLYLEQKLQETQDKLNETSHELKDVQMDIDAALTRKKVALDEVHVLEDQLKRTKADVKTSENLAEKYKQQVTITRSELMGLEVERDTARQDIKDMENMLIKQKQEMSEAFKVEKKNERKAMELSLENSKLQRELETCKTKFSQLETSLVNEKKLLLDKIRMLQEELQDEQKSNKATVQSMKEQLEEERQSARSSHYERIQSIHKFQDEAKEMQEKELESLKTRLTREHELQLEKLQEKSKREVDALGKSAKDAEFRISQLNCTLKARDEEVELLKTKLLDEKQKLCESELAHQEEMDKQNSFAKSLQAEINALQERESNLTSSNRALEQSFDDKTNEVRRLKDQLQNLVDESSKVEESQKEEIQMLRSLVRQQEDATRLLGEKMRNEAQEQIRTALQREREAVDKEREKQKEKLIEIKNSYDEVLNQLRGELDSERKSHQQLQTTALKLKKEVDELRERNLRTQEEKVSQIGQLRLESKEQIMKLKDKVQELSLLTDKNEKDIVLEINEECRRMASIVGGSPNTTPINPSNLSSSFSSGFDKDSPGSNTNSPAREALANLKSCNAELRQHLVEARREIETQKNESSRKQSDNTELAQQQISLFKKALRSKDDEIARLKRHVQEDTNRNASLYKSERSMMQKTIERLEKELKETRKLIPASSPITNGHSFTDNTSTSGVGTSLRSMTVSPRTGDDNNSARLLRHLQGRVQQLRAQNDSLRSDSLNESQTSVGTVDSTFDRDGIDDPNLTKKLQSALQASDQRANKNATMLSQKMLEMTKLQKMLTHATKENMKLERAYASLQKKMIDTSPSS